MTEQNLMPCHWHKTQPLSGTQRHGLWVTWCSEPNCELTGVYKTIEESVQAWNQMMERCEGLVSHKLK